ncbi:MAG: F0F1 ATP synthase subunit B [Myxococcaceae bacterium]
MPFVPAAALTQIQPGLIFWTIVTFVLVALVLRAKAWKPILQVVEEREKSITEAIESAKRERAEAEKLLEAQKAAMNDARREAAEMMRKNQADMERFRDELMAKSRKEADDLKADAARAIDDEKMKAIAQVKAEAVGLAIQIAEKLLSERLDDERHRKLAEQFISQLPAQAAARPPL